MPRRDERSKKKIYTNWVIIASNGEEKNPQHMSIGVKVDKHWLIESSNKLMNHGKPRCAKRK